MGNLKISISMADIEPRIKEALDSFWHEIGRNGVLVKWQEGTVLDAGVNGAQVNDVLELALERLRELNKQFPCRENAVTITKLEEAIMWQDKRTNDRIDRGVEGVNQL
ncbi:hypothetical protein [Listeria booriae]|uniref:hypothetical protein n=1 Tax=Listeria booriae TaxID=1552123 RepID=UPI0021AB3F4D|nr:hypothetical protein [Listeria booriae]